jgi:predicted DNA-binding transcriptional regulator YafY
MTETAAARLRRLLLLMPNLADGGDHRVDDLAVAIGTDRETLVRDIETLVTRADDPGGFVPGVQVYFTGDRVSVTSSSFRRPMRLTASGLGALELGLAMLRAERPPDERKAVNGALERLRAAMVHIPSDAVAAGQRAASLPDSGDSATLAAVQKAMSMRRKIRIRYRGGGKSEVSERIVRPYALVVASGAWYAVAHCDSVAALRSFRLDRVEGVEATEESYEIPTTFSTDEFLNDRKVLRAGQPRMMRVRYSARIARWIAEREGLQRDADGSLTMEHPLADVQWGVRHVLQYGPDAEVLEPADVREELTRRLRRLAGAT